MNKIGLPTKIFSSLRSAMANARCKMQDLSYSLKKIPLPILEARAKAVLKGAPILWGVEKVAEELTILVREGKGKIEVSEIKNNRIREILIKQGIEQFKVDNWSDITAEALLIMLKRAAMEMEENLSCAYTFVTRHRNFLYRENILLVRRGTVIEVKRWIVEQRGVY